MSEWISVKERMPEPGKRVLATIAAPLHLRPARPPRQWRW